MKEYNVIYTLEAQECLLSISEYIAEDNPPVAKAFIKNIINSLDKSLSLFPLSSPICENIGYGVRLYPYKKYNCYYWLNTDKKDVEILFVFNSAKDTKGKLAQYMKGLKSNTNF